jgi:hypothetical protein
MNWSAISRWKEMTNHLYSLPAIGLIHGFSGRCQLPKPYETNWKNLNYWVQAELPGIFRFIPGRNKPGSRK